MTTNSNGLHRHYDRLSPEERFRLDVLATARGDARESEKLTSSCPRKTYTANDYGFSGRWQAAVETTLFVCLDLSQHLCKLQMLDALTETVPFLRTPHVNLVVEAYLDGHEAGSRHAWKMAGMEGDPPGWKSSELEDDTSEAEVDEVDEASALEDPRLEEDIDALAERVKEEDLLPTLFERFSESTRKEALAVWEGYRRFCEGELDLDARKLLSCTLAPITESVDELVKATDAAGEPLEPDEGKVSEYEAVLKEVWSRSSREFERLSKAGSTGEGR